MIVGKSRVNAARILRKVQKYWEEHGNYPVAGEVIPRRTDCYSDTIYEIRTDMMNGLPFTHPMNIHMRKVPGHYEQS